MRYPFGGGRGMLSWQNLVLLALAAALVWPDWVFRLASKRLRRVYGRIVLALYEAVLLGVMVKLTALMSGAEGSPRRYGVEWWHPVLWTVMFLLMRACHELWLRSKV